MFYGALPLRYEGFICSYRAMNSIWTGTGSKFRSYVLSANDATVCFRYTTPVFCLRVFNVHTERWTLYGLVPATGFDPVSSELWAPRASSAPCRLICLRFILGVVHTERWTLYGLVPPTGFDPVTLKLWAWALFRWVKGVFLRVFVSSMSIQSDELYID